MDLKEFRWEGKNKILLTLDRDVDTGGEAKQHPSPHTEIWKRKLKLFLLNYSSILNTLQLSIKYSQTACIQIYKKVLWLPPLKNRKS